MARLWSCGLIFGGVAFLAATQTTLAADPDRGRELATRWCTSCHVVADNVAGGTLGPAFEVMVPVRDRSEAQLKRWLAAPHDPMPDFGLSALEINDLVAYIVSLNPS